MPRERRTRAAPIAKALHDWLIAQRIKIMNGTATAKAIDYSLNRWAALTRYVDDPALPIDNNHDAQQIRPSATGRKNWLFAGTLMAGQRAAALDPVGQAQRARPVRLPEGRPGPTADSARSRHRRALAASLGPARLTAFCLGVNVCSLAAYFRSAVTDDSKSPRGMHLNERFTSRGDV